MKHILCPTDLSVASARAIDLAIAVASWYRARLTALHVYNPLFVPVPGLPTPSDRVPQAEVQRIREEIAARFQVATTAGVDVDVVVDVGQPVPHILKRAVSLPADIIVMGTHGASGFEHLILGSVTEKILRKAGCAVLTVPARAQATSTLPFKRLLCAVDFSDSSLAALERACSLAQESGASLTLLHVLEWPWEEPPPPAFDELPPAQASALAEYRRFVETSALLRLKTLVPTGTPGCPTPEARISHGKSYLAILQTAEQVSADLIVMGIRGRAALDMMLLGSTTNQIVRRASCPVLTIRR
jgi:nucleotide-binding universal stress UspA family protein